MSCIYVYSAETVTDLELKADTSVSLEIQFQLNRIPFCESHRAVNCVSDYRHYISGFIRYSRNTKNVTGKTFTLARAVIRILWEKDTKILIFTRSNSAADFYIKEYLHPYVESGLIDATPLRIYYRKRWLSSTVNSTVLDLSPEILSQFAREMRFHVWLLQRLYGSYLAEYPCKIVFRGNYRTHKAIVEFTSTLFYDCKLLSLRKQPR
ncbi:hypothetical protein PGB90_006093 [Kerria lacca]